MFNSMVVVPSQAMWRTSQGGQLLAALCYFALSFAAFSCKYCCEAQNFVDQLSQTEMEEPLVASDVTELYESILGKSTNFAQYPQLAFALRIFSSKVAILVMMNLAFSCFVFFVVLAKVVFFGKLSAMETRKLVERVINYTMFKVVVIGAVVEPDLLEVFLWNVWFCTLGVLKIFSGLSRDRCDRLASTPAATSREHMRILLFLALLSTTLLGCGGLCLYVFQHAALSELLLLLFEVVLIAANLSQTTLRFSLHLLELWSTQHQFATAMRVARRENTAESEGQQEEEEEEEDHEGRRSSPAPSFSERATEWAAAWAAYLGEWRGTLLYHTEVYSDCATSMLTLAHYLHIWWLHGMAFQMIDALLFLNIKTLATNLKHRVHSHLHYCKATHNLKEAFPDATEDQLKEFNDECAICKERMTCAKRLPCGHLFHLSCLRSWLEQGSMDNYTCPTCRASLLVPGREGDAKPPTPTPAAIHEPQDNNTAPPNETRPEVVSPTRISIHRNSPAATLPNVNPSSTNQAAPFSLRLGTDSDPITTNIPSEASMGANANSSVTGISSPMPTPVVTVTPPAEGLSPRRGHPLSALRPGRLFRHLQERGSRSRPSSPLPNSHSLTDLQSSEFEDALTPTSLSYSQSSPSIVLDPALIPPSAASPESNNPALAGNSELRASDSNPQMFRTGSEPSLRGMSPGAVGRARRISSGSNFSLSSNPLPSISDVTQFGNEITHHDSDTSGDLSVASTHPLLEESIPNPSGTMLETDGSAEQIQPGNSTSDAENSEGGPRGLFGWLPRLFPFVGLPFPGLWSTQDLNGMADTVQEILPHAPRDAILRELRRSWNIEFAVNNLIESSNG